VTTEPEVPILAPPRTAAQLRATSTLSLAALDLPDLPSDGVQLVTHVDFRSGSATIGGVVEVKDWRGGVIATRHADGRWSASGQVTWTWK
jgi:hypothetical protein